jgi:hypothetical protein
LEPSSFAVSGGDRWLPPRALRQTHRAQTITSRIRLRQFRQTLAFQAGCVGHGVN